MDCVQPTVSSRGTDQGEGHNRSLAPVALVAGAVVGFLIALTRPRSWK